MHPFHATPTLAEAERAMATEHPIIVKISRVSPAGPHVGEARDVVTAFQCMAGGKISRRRNVEHPLVYVLHIACLLATNQRS